MVHLTEDLHIFPAHIERLGGMLQWIRIHLLEMAFEEGVIRKVELASEEALVNIIRHGYKAREGKIMIRLFSFADHVEIVIIDEGPPFNPLLEESHVDSLACLEERKEGGLGILFMRQYMDEVRYQREANHNVLTLIKKLAS